MNGKENLDLAIKLVTIDSNVDVEIDIDKLEKQSMNKAVLSDYFSRLEIHSLSAQLDKITTSKTKPSPEQSIKKTYKTISTLEEIEKLVDDIKGCSLLSFDIETTQLDPVEADIAGFALSLKENQGYYIPIIFPDKDSIPGHNIDLVDDVDHVEGPNDSHGYSLKNYIEYLANEI